MVRRIESRAALVGALLCLAPACANVWGFDDLTVGDAAPASDATGGGEGDATAEHDLAPGEAGEDVLADTAGPLTESSSDATLDAGSAADAPMQDAAETSATDASSVPDSDAATPVDAPGESGPTVALTVTVVTYGPTTANLGSSPAGVNCSGGCVQTLDVSPSTPVHLALTGVLGTLARWGGACAGNGLTCDVTVNAATSVKLTLNAWNYAFVTSATQQASFGGLNPVDSGLPPADALCAQAATSASLPGTYRAYFSTATASARSRLTGARGWIRVDGLPVFDSVATMDQGTMYYPLDLNENQQKQDTCAWTGSYADGTFDGTTCSGWTSSSSSATTEVGVTSLQSGFWANSQQAYFCSSSCAVYCLGTDLAAPLPAPSNTGRLAFVTKGAWSPSSGVAAANNLCSLEAAGASLVGTFTALLASSTASAISAGGFTLSGAPWVRPDGVLVAANPAALAAGNLSASIDVHADGSHAGATWTLVWTGGSTPSTPGTSASTCGNWSSADAGATGPLQGWADSVATPAFFDLYGYSTDCVTAKPVYCLQQ